MPENGYIHVDGRLDFQNSYLSWQRFRRYFFHPPSFQPQNPMTTAGKGNIVSCD